MEGMVTNESLYKSLPQSVNEDGSLGLGNTKHQHREYGKYLSSFLRQHVPASKIKSDGGLEKLEGNLQYKVHSLDNTVARPKRYNKAPNKYKTLTSKERKDLKLFQLKPEEQKYAMYLPMHKLWKQYMEEVINFTKFEPSNKQDVEGKLLKADYHGSIVTVTRSKCPSLVGTTGIVVQETRNVFKIITKEDQLKTIPKGNSVFTLKLKDNVITLYGNQFRYKSSERVVRKFKMRATIDL